MDKNYIIFSSYINAYSIRKALNKEGIYNVFIANDMAAPYFYKIPKIKPKENDVLLFTTEEKLLEYLPLKKQYSIPFKANNTSWIDNKLNFAHFLLSINEIPVDFYSTLNDVKHFPVLLKGIASMKNNKRVPRGFVLNSLQDMAKIGSEINIEGFELSDFYIQKYLPDAILNVSVCGFYDSELKNNEFITITQKTIMDNTPLKGSTGDIVVEINDDYNLIERSKNILQNLDFKGVFELEFIFDKSDNTYKILELNPRFWMQHGIFIEKNNSLIKAVLGKQFDSKINKNKIAWVNTIALMENIKNKRFEMVKFIFSNFFNYKFHFAPSLFQFFKYKFFLK